jgi:hypothetical protein
MTIDLEFSGLDLKQQWSHAKRIAGIYENT